MLSACSRFPVWLNLTCLFASLSLSLSLPLSSYSLHLALSNSSLLSLSNIFSLHFLSLSPALFPTLNLFFSTFHFPFSSLASLPLSFFTHLLSSSQFLPTSLFLPPLLLPCLPSLLSFSDSTPCSLHVYFWSLSSSPHASITSPWFSLSVSLSSSLLPLSLLRYLLFPNLSHPHAHVCTGAPAPTCTRRCGKNFCLFVFKRRCILGPVCSALTFFASGNMKNTLKKKRKKKRLLKDELWYQDKPHQGLASFVSWICWKRCTLVKLHTEGRIYKKTKKRDCEHW